MVGLTKVVRLQRSNGVIIQNCDVYIGRQINQGGWNLEGSKWANAFIIGSSGVPDVVTAIFKYWEWIHSREPLPPGSPKYIGKPEDLRNRISEIVDRVMGCWCKGKKENPDEYCHGDVLLFLAEGHMTSGLQKVLQLMGTPNVSVTNQMPSYSSPRVDVNRLRSMLLGVFLGDALGAPHEFGYNSSVAYTGELIHQTRFISQYQGTRYLVVGQVTDDSEMTLALGRSIITNRGYVKEEVIQSYLQWANSGNVMIGRNTRSLFKSGKTLKSYHKNYQAAFSTLESRATAQSNGALMRSTPLACLWTNDPVIEDAGLTNPSKVAVDAELTYVTALRLALIGTDTQTIWTTIKSITQTNEVKELLDDIEQGVIRDLGNIDGQKRKGWVLNTLYAAYHCLYRIVTDPHKDLTSIFANSMKWVITQPNTDTDTNAAVTGGLIGAIVGWEQLIKDETTIRNLSVILNADTTKGDYPRPKEYGLSDIETLVQQLTVLSGI
jgi:ADP-ribosylglycohydrolase